MINELWRYGEGVACVERVSHETVDKIKCEIRSISTKQTILQSRSNVLAALFLLTI